MTNMKRQLTILISVSIAVGINPLSAETKPGPGLGKSIPPGEIAKWDISIFPDGEGLPAGAGTVAEGERIYRQHCVACHGEDGLGATADQLAGAHKGLTSDYPEKTIGSYWPYATTLFDVIRRSMPMTAPGSLSDDQVYAVTAYLLYLNNLIGKEDKMNAETLPRVKMPNADGFIEVYRQREKSE